MQKNHKKKKNINEEDDDDDFIKYIEKKDKVRDINKQITQLKLLKKEFSSDLVEESDKRRRVSIRKS